MHPIATKKLFLLDMDGTLYLGNRLFDGTIDFLNEVRARGGRYIFVTNNSSKSVNDYVAKLNRMGIEATEEDFLTSSQATGEYLLQYHKNDKMYVFGTQSLKKELYSRGLNITDKYEEGIQAVVMGFDTELTFQKLEDTCKLLIGHDEIPYIATNPDWVCPTEYGSVPDCGSISHALKNSIGRLPRFIGKPEPEMVYLAMKKTGFGPDETVVIGDRIYTDIASGLNAGVSTALVMSGETTYDVLEASERKPEFVFKDIREICGLLQEK